jgi:anti-sigma regulatory factor (Ser/Thr protein kinase)
MCAYDRRTTPAEKLREVARTHPRTACPDGSHPASETYVDPVTYLSEPRPVAADPVQSAPPYADLVDPTPALARRVVREANRGTVGADDLADLVVAVSEAVTNAMVHGRPPVGMRVWTGPDRIVVTVADGGGGPEDPFAGLLPADDRASGGRGLWIVHQSCNHVTAEVSPDGFTLRLTAGDPG